MEGPWVSCNQADIEKIKSHLCFLERTLKVKKANVCFRYAIITGLKGIQIVSKIIQAPSFPTHSSFLVEADKLHLISDRFYQANKI